MSSCWFQRLAGRGAVVEEGLVRSFGDEASEAREALAGDVAADLSAVGVVGVFGPSAGNFLQRLFTNDVALVGPERSGLGAACTPQGRVIAVFRLLLSQGEYQLLLPRSMAGKMVEWLAGYRFRAPLVIEERREALRRVGVSGPRAGEYLTRAGLPVPAEPGGFAQGGPVAVLRLPGIWPRFQLLGPEEALSGLWDSLPARPVGNLAWSLLSVAAGMPRIYPATSAAFLPQWLGLERLGGLSFSKGCYPGQEVVARTQHMGRITRVLRRGRTAGEVPAPGSRIFEIGSGGPADGGTTLEAAADGEGGVQLLAVAKVAAEGRRPLRWGTETGPLITWEEGKEGSS